jgi:hypothetical protein
MKQIIEKNWQTILKICAGVFLLYWMIFILTPSINTSSEIKAKIDSLNVNIKNLEKTQNSLQTKIDDFNQEIIKIDDKIIEIKGQKTIIKEIYHEKIRSISNYTDNQLDSFFAERYKGYYPY